MACPDRNHRNQGGVNGWRTASLSVTALPVAPGALVAPLARRAVGVCANTSRTVSLNCRMLAKPAANAMSDIGIVVHWMSIRAVVAR